MMITSPQLAGAARHGFFTREGGVSDGLYASLNCGTGSDDIPAHVAENRGRAASSLGVHVDRLVTPYQVHSADVAVVDRDWKMGSRPEVDALVTREAGIALGVVTADCVPVMLYDQTQQVVAALHAGWKGTLAGIVSNTVAAMVSLGATPGTISAAVGPCIAQPSYEVGDELFQAFTSANPEWTSFFVTSDREGHHRFDLGGVVSACLGASDISDIDLMQHDTYADESRFFSFRRTTHRHEPYYGRQLSAIVLEVSR
jgi:polyphenol oxidase